MWYRSPSSYNLKDGMMSERLKERLEAAGITAAPFFVFANTIWDGDEAWKVTPGIILIILWTALTKPKPCPKCGHVSPPEEVTT